MFRFVFPFQTAVGFIVAFCLSGDLIIYIYISEGVYVYVNISGRHQYLVESAIFSSNPATPTRMHARAPSPFARGWYYLVGSD